MTLEELRSRLIEVCRGKEGFVRPLEMMAERVDSRCWRFDPYREILESYEQPNYVLDCPPALDCSDCPMNDLKRTEGIDCRCPDLHIPNMERDKLRDFAKETLNLAIASCNGEEVKVEVEEVPVDNPSKPLFIVTKVDDLIGLESEDGRFKVIKHRAYQTGFEVIGVRSSFQYYEFEDLNFDSEQILGELTFRFTIQKKKSHLELLEECDPVEFKAGGDNIYIIQHSKTLEVGYSTVGTWFTPGIKYISKEDADKIIKECVENA